MTRFEFSSAEVGRFFGRDHTTMLSANKETEARAAGDPVFADELSAIEIAALVHARLRQAGLLRAAPQIDPAAAAWRIVEGGAREAARASIQEIMAMADALSRIEEQPEQEFRMSNATHIHEVGGKPYRQDTRGALVPESAIKPMDLLQDEQVRKMVGFARDLSGQIARFKGHTYDDIGSLQALIAQEYGAKIGGQKGNITLTSFDGLLKVQVQVQDQIDFGAELQAAKELVDECLREWAADSRDEIRALVTRAFQVDTTGKINRAEIFMLLRVEILDPRWNRAMDAVRDFIRVIGSKSYVRFFEREAPDAAWRPITIDLASA